MNPASRVIMNTVVLYIKLLLAIIIGLFTTRLVLAALGETNYGIYSLVAGVIGMLGFLQGAMSGASMRFLSHSVGLGQEDILLKTFNTTLFLHFALGVLLVVIMELGGMVLFKYYLNIPKTSISDAKIVFHFMVLTTFVTVISVPYDAVMNSHENMFFLSMTDLFGNILRLSIAIYLTYTKANVLITYGILMFLTQIVLRIIKQIYSSKKYPECRISFFSNVDKNLIKSILSFSSWSLLGAISSMSATEIKSVLLNMFFGVRLNAANGISMTVANQVNTFSTSMTQAIRPQLVKSEGNGDREKMLRIMHIATKFSIFLFTLFAIPVIVELPYLLHIWLKVVPEYTVIFCRLILIGILLDKFTFEIGTAINAVGNIKNMSITESSAIILSVIVSYYFFKLGFPPYAIFVVNIFFSCGIFALRLYFGKSVTGLKIKTFIQVAIIPLLIPILIAFSCALMPRFFMDDGLLRFFSTCLISMFIFCILFASMSMTPYELQKVRVLVSSGLYKFKNKFSYIKKY